MTPAARLSAAIELIDTIDAQRVPAAKALKEWGTAHRYAGSGDRAAISGLIWDVLRRRASSAWIMDDDRPRARVLGMLKLERGLDVDAIAALCDGGRFAPEPLTEGERAALASRSLENAPAHIAGDYPEWLDGYLAQMFGDDRVAEATAMASRAPLDLRVNTLKAKREKALASLAHLGAQPTPWSPTGLRIELGADARNPGIHAEEDFIKGGIEVQDEGSQLAALLSAAKPGEQVIDLCAGAGGKALAKPGGRIAYITCSVLPPENGEQVRAFVARHPEFGVVPPPQTVTALGDKAEEFAAAARQSPEGLLMTPRRTGTDGFFVSILNRRTSS